MRVLFASAVAVTLFMSPVLAATSDTVPAATSEPTTSTTGKPTPATQQDKIRDCAAKWKAAKAAGETKGQSHRQFKKACLKNAA